MQLRCAEAQLVMELVVEAAPHILPVLVRRAFDHRVDVTACMKDPASQVC